MWAIFVTQRYEKIRRWMGLNTSALRNAREKSIKLNWLFWYSVQPDTADSAHKTTIDYIFDVINFKLWH